MLMCVLAHVWVMEANSKCVLQLHPKESDTYFIGAFKIHVHGGIFLNTPLSLFYINTEQWQSLNVY